MFLKLCTHIVNILKMCMWGFDGARINFDRIAAFKLSHFWQLFGTMAYNQLPKLLKDSFHTLQTCWEHNEDNHYGVFKIEKIYLSSFQHYRIKSLCY